MGQSTITVKLDDDQQFSYDVPTETVKQHIDRISEFGVRHSEGATTFRVFPPHRIRHIDVGAKELD